MYVLCTTAAQNSHHSRTDKNSQNMCCLDGSVTCIRQLEPARHIILFFVLTLNPYNISVNNPISFTVISHLNGNLDVKNFLLLHALTSSRICPISIFGKIRILLISGNPPLQIEAVVEAVAVAEVEVEDQEVDILLTTMLLHLVLLQ